MNFFNRKSEKTPALSLGIALIAGLAAPAWAGKPWFSGPSTIQIGVRQTFNGGGFAPDAPVHVRVQDARGDLAEDYVVTNAEGQFRYEVTPEVSGSHALSVLDLNGVPLAEAAFAAF